MRRYIDDFISSEWKTRLIYLLALSLPFEYLPTLQLGSINLRISTVFAGLLIILALPGLLRLVSARQVSWLEALLIIWVSWLGLGVLLGSNLHDGLIAYLPLLFLVAMSFSLRLLLVKAKHRQLVFWLVLGGLLAIVAGVYQFIGNLLGLSQGYTGLRDQYSWQRLGFPRMQSVALEPLYFSAYLLLPFSLLSSILIRIKSSPTRFFVAILLLVTIADTLTVSRGGLAAAVLGFIIIAAWNYRAWPQLLKIAAVLLASGAIVLGIIALVGRQGNDTDNTYGTKGVGTLTSHLGDFHFTPSAQSIAKDDSISQRSQSRNQAKQIIKDYPKVLIAGTGFGQYHDFAKAHYSNPDGGEPNNVIYEQLVQTGLIGLGLLLAVLVLLLKGLWTVAKKSGDGYTQALAIGLLAFILGIGLQAQTFTGLIITPLWFVVGLAMFLIQSNQQTKHKHHAKVHSTKT